MEKGFKFCDPLLYNSTDVSSIIDRFEKFDLITGGSLFLFMLVYSFFSIKNLIYYTQKQKDFITAQIMFMIGLLAKSCALFFSGILINGRSNWGTITAILHGFSGYMTGVAYCYIFFSWTSACSSFLGKDFAHFISSLRSVLYTLIVFMIVCFVSMICLMLLSSQSTIAHYIEAGVASFRDIVLSLSFFSYFRKIFSLAEPPYCDFSKPETGIIFLSLYLIITLSLRSLSIITYALYWSDWGSIFKNKNRECTNTYFGVYAFEQLVYELSPLIIIGITRIKHIMYESYDPILQ